MNPTQIGPYLILDKLGAGGMGSVYLGRHKDTGLVAAVKVLPASLAREEGFIERFEREVDAMQRLNNPHIVKVYDSGVDGETYYFAMEYVAGETVMSMLRRDRKVSWQKAVDIALQVCQALKAAHDAGIVHRDLKPSNLLIAENGMVKLTDFGVAQIFAAPRLTVTRGVVGTAEFMSPEQARGQRATKQSDLYSLGALMYVLITGRPPFGGATAVDVMHKHQFGQFEKPRMLIPDLPSWIEEIIVQLLEKAPEKRIPDALVLSRRLEQALRKIALSSSSDLGNDETEITLSEGELLDEDTSTVAASSSQRQRFSERGHVAGPATLMQKLLRVELEDMLAGPWYQRLFNNTYVLVVLLFLTIGGGIWWFWPRPLTGSQMYEAGMELLQQPAGPDWIRARDQFFKPLLQADPDRWGEELAPQMRRIELYELSRPEPELVKRLRARRDAQSQKSPVGEFGLSDQVARFLQQARAYEQLGDIPRAQKILESLRELLRDDPSQTRALDLVNHYLEVLRETRQSDTNLEVLPKGALERAEKLVASGNVAGARKIWEALVELYRDDPAATSFVATARDALAKHPAPKSAASPAKPSEESPSPAVPPKK